MDGELAITELVPISVVYGCPENTVNTIKRRIPGFRIYRKAAVGVVASRAIYCGQRNVRISCRVHTGTAHTRALSLGGDTFSQTTWEHCAGAGRRSKTSQCDAFSRGGLGATWKGRTYSAGQCARTPTSPVGGSDPLPRRARATGAGAEQRRGQEAG